MTTGKNPSVVLMDEVASDYIPERGDVILIDSVEPKTKGEVVRVHALVVSVTDFNSWSALGMVVPITDKIRRRPFEVAMLNTNTSGVAHADSVTSIDYRSRHASFVEKAPDDVLEDVLEKIAVIFDL